MPLGTLHTFTGTVVEVNPPRSTFSVMDLVMVREAPRTFHDEFLHGVSVPSGTVAVDDIVRVRIEDGKYSLMSA